MEDVRFSCFRQSCFLQINFGLSSVAVLQIPERSTCSCRYILRQANGEELQSGTKEYYATIRLGATTPSYDLEKPIDATYPTEHITREMVEQVLERFRGRIEQVPPTFSACKVDGKRAYKIARKGDEVELKPKTLVIDELELTECNLPDITIRVVCSKGTYIRALARDIGEALQSGGHLIALRRTRVGDYKVEECLNPEKFSDWLDAAPIEATEKEQEKQV